MKMGIYIWHAKNENRYCIGEWDPFNYLVRGHLLTEQPNTYWLCDISTVYAGDEVIEVNIDLKLKQNRKCIDKAYYTIYVDKEGGVDRIEQK